MINDGILEFSSFEDLDKFLFSANYADYQSLIDWEERNSFYSQRRMFYDVMKAEDELDEYLYSLPADEQLKKLEEGEYYSDVLQQKLEQGLIKFHSSPDDESSYWDYAVIEPNVAPALNLDGIVKVDNKILKYSNTEFLYIIHDGDLQKLSMAEMKTETYHDDYISVYKRQPFHPEGDFQENHDHKRKSLMFCFADQTHTVNYGKTNTWRNPTNKKRLKAWIEGSARAEFGFGCRYGTTCTFQLRTQAQKKNFWGKWKYSSSWGPYCFVDDANWTYNVEFNQPAGECSSSNQVTEFDFITGGSNPKPLWDYYISWTNNGFFAMHPHVSGWWTFEQGNLDKYICRTIDVTYDVPVQFYTYGANEWNLNN